MQIYEYQLKKLLNDFGIPVLHGAVAYTPKEALDVAKSIKAKAWVVKAQIHDDLTRQNEGNQVMTFQYTQQIAEIPDIAQNMLGKMIHIGPHTYEIKKVYIEEQVKIKTRYALSFRIDYSKGGIVLDTLYNGRSKEIEVPLEGLSSFACHRLAHTLDIPGELTSSFCHIIRRVFDFFRTYELIGIELNPLIITSQNTFYVLESRCVFDPDALYRHPEITKLYELDERVQQRVLALKNKFRYLKLKGNIACIVNGAGLSLATLDLMQTHKGSVGCLLDVGPNPTQEVITKAFKMILSEPDIDGVFVNLFGGTSRCDIIAKGLIAASDEIALRLPLVVRMEGTNASIGERLLTNARLPFQIVSSMADGVKKITHLVQQGGL